MARRGVWLPIAVLVVAAGLVAWWTWPDEASSPRPVAVRSTAPLFGTLAELVGASDLVVAGVVTGGGDGRVVTDPADPEAGIRTALLRIDVEETLRGPAPDPLVVEHEVALLDGTPITVDGVAPPEPGDRVVLFLVASPDPTAPYHAVVGAQGRYRLDGDDLTPVVDDPLAADIAAGGMEELRTEIAAR